MTFHDERFLGLRSFRRAARPRWPFAFSGFIVVLTAAACGGGSAAPLAPDSNPEPTSDAISFARIAGDWVGRVTEVQTSVEYDVAITLRNEAHIGGTVGSILYTNGRECEATLTLLAAVNQVYAIGQRVSYGLECLNTTLQLTPAADYATLELLLFDNSTGDVKGSAVLARP